MAKMIQCPKCGKPYYSTLKMCPECGMPRPKNTKKTVTIVLACVAAFLIIGVISGLANENKPVTEIETGGIPSSSDVQTSGNNSKNQQNNQSSVEQLIYSDNYIKASFIKVEDASDIIGSTALTTCYVSLKIENISSQTYTVSLTEAYANDSQITMMSALPMTLAPGKSSNQPFMFGYNNVLTSTDDLRKLEFKIMLLGEDMGTIETTKTITVNIK